MWLTFRIFLTPSALQGGLVCEVVSSVTLTSATSSIHSSPIDLLSVIRRSCVLLSPTRTTNIPVTKLSL